MAKASKKGTRSRKMRRTRRSRRKSGVSRRRRCWAGGAQTVFPADVNDMSMDSPSKLSLAQGGDYENLHEGQHGGRWQTAHSAPAHGNYMLEASRSDSAHPGHSSENGNRHHQMGGAAVSLAAAAPPGYTGMLDDSLRATARVTPLDESMSATVGMSDQSGGRRRRKSMNSRKRKSMNSRKRKSMASRRRRRQGGGAAMTPLGQAADFGSPGMLLSPSQEAQALGGMNPEWKLASDPGAFKPAGL